PSSSPVVVSLLFFLCCSRFSLSLHSLPTRRSSDLCYSCTECRAEIAHCCPAPFQSVVSVRSGVRHLLSGYGPHRCELTRQIDKGDRKSTRLNSSHVKISYAVFCLKKKKKKIQIRNT